MNFVLVAHVDQDTISHWLFNLNLDTYKLFYTSYKVFVEICTRFQQTVESFFSQ